MSGICPELDARLSAELDRYYFSTDGSGLNLDRREKHRVINALHRLWNIEEIACYGVGFATEDIRKVILDLMKPAHIRLALKTVDFNSGAAYSLWLGCAIFMFAKFDEDLQHEIRKGILSRGYLPLVVAGFLSEVVITEKGKHISQRIKVNLSLKEKTQYDFARIVTHGTARKSYAEGNYFMVPNSVLYMDLSGGEILLYACLLYYEDRRTHTCYPSFREIGERIGMSKNTVMKYLRSLEKRGLVETEQTLIRTKSGEVHNGTLKYHITPIAPIKKAYDEKELDKLKREAEMRERIAKYERHTKNSVHAENHAENGQMRRFMRRSIFKQEKGRASKTLARITSAGRALRFPRVLTAFARFFAGFAGKKTMRKCMSKIA